MADQRTIVQRYEELSADWSDENADELGRLQDQIDAQNLWELDRHVETAMDALRLPPAGREGGDALRRRAAPRRAVPAAPPAQRHAAARRAHQPPRRGVGGVAGALPEGVQGHRRRRDPRPLLPGQRGGLDPRAGPRRRHPLGRQLLVLARPEEEPAGPGGEGDQQPPAHARARAGVGAHGAPRPPGQGQGPPHPLRGAAGRAAGRGQARRRRRDHDPARPAPGRPRHRGQGPAQGLRRQPAHGRRQLHAAPRRHRGRDRPQRRGQDHAVPHDRRPGEAGRGRARRSARAWCCPTSTRAATR